MVHTHTCLSNKLNQRGELVKYPTTLRHLRKTDKTTHQSTLMLWEGNRQIQEYTDDFVFTTVYDDQGFEPVARVVQDRQDTSQIKVYHYHNNHLGTPQELTDECGNVIWANYEWAWGGRYNHFYKEQSLNNYAILEHDLQPIRFQGQFYDVETSLHYNRFRYYDSDVGMFISRDPIGLLGGNNVFQYADNPILFIDPFGLAPYVKGIIKEQEFNRKNDPKVEFYIKKWLCTATSWESAVNVAEEEKKRPDFSKDPLDDHHRTAAEHYIFMRAMINKNSESTKLEKAVFSTVGVPASLGYGAAKNAGFFPNAGKPHRIQTRWELKGYDDAMSERLGFKQKFNIGNCDYR